MNRVPVFISFDRAHHLATKNRLVAEWAGEGCPIWIKDVSLAWAVMEQRCQTEAARVIESAKTMLVIRGKNPHSADGVMFEVQTAAKRREPTIYRRAFSERTSLPRSVAAGTQMTGSHWKAVHAAIGPMANQQ